MFEGQIRNLEKSGVVAVGRTGRVPRAEGQRELGGWSGCVAWTKGDGGGSGEWGGYRCSPEVRCEFRRGWLVCSRKVTVVICSGQLSRRGRGTWELRRDIRRLVLNWTGNYLHSRCFLYPCSISKFSLLCVIFYGCNWNQSLRVRKNDTAGMFVSPFPTPALP